MASPEYTLLFVIVLGGAGQWLGHLLRVPSILLLLLLGFLAGPVTGLILPDALFGQLLLPFVSFSVALILFEGGLSLRFVELRGIGSVVLSLVTVGAACTWLVADLAAHYFIGLDWNLSVLLGAILTVTGPTVVLPLLRHVQPKGRCASILKWEGIVIDPIGAMAAVLVFDFIVAGGAQPLTSHLALATVRTILVGAGLGIGFAWLLAAVIRTYVLPDTLQVSVALTLVLAAFAASNSLQPESGLLAATVMGITLANQKRAHLDHIVAFKENLRVLLLSSVFVLLSARLRLQDLQLLGPEIMLFVLAMVVVARPLCVLASTFRSTLNWRERFFLMCMAPRGIVAAAVASVFALILEKQGYTQARLLLPVTFATIVGTVLFYGLAAAPIATALGIGDRDPQGLLIAGAGVFARSLAGAVQSAGFRVLLVDTSRASVNAAQMSGLSAYNGSILGADLLDRIELGGIGRLVALTPNDGVNALAVQRFRSILGSRNLYQIPARPDALGRPKLAGHLRGRHLSGAEVTLGKLEEMLESGYVIKTTRLTAEFDYQAFVNYYKHQMLPLMYIDRTRLSIIGDGNPAVLRPGQTIIAVVQAAGINKVTTTNTIESPTGQATPVRQNGGTP